MKYLSDYSEEKQTKLFNDTGAFFAFGGAQFKEKRKEGVVYVDFGYGLIVPKSNYKKLAAGLEEINKQAVAQDVAENGADAIIEREYFNHECQLVGDTSSAVDALDGHIEQFPELFTKEAMTRVFKNAFLKACENDWF